MANLLKKYFIYVFLVGIFIASSWSLFSGKLFRIHDYTHAARIVEMSDALKDGHFPVIWSSDFGYGYGMPLFEFYAPLPYYVGAIFNIIGFSAQTCVLLLFYLANILTIIGSYKLGKHLFGSLWGTVVSAAISLAPYRAVNLFVRGAVSESWGIMALPFILLGIAQIVDKKKNGWLTLLISISTLILSHNLTALMFLPLSIIFGGVYLFIQIRKSKQGFTEFFKQTLVLAGVYFLALLLTSFYFIPALLEKDFTRLESQILGGYFDYNLHFLYIRQFFNNYWGYGGSQWGPDDQISFYLGTGQILSLLAVLLIFIKSLFRDLKNKNIKKLFTNKNILFVLSGLLLLISLFMSLFKSKVLWDSLNFLSFIQFPWRWMSSAIIFLGISLGFMGLYLKNNLQSRVLAFILLIIIVIGNFGYFRPESYLENPDDFYYTNRMLIRTNMSSILPDYIPSQIGNDLLSNPVDVDKILFCETSDQETGCNYSYEILLNRTHEKLISVNLSQATIIEFSTANFPGWIVQVDGNAVKIEESENGLVSINVPQGNHLVGLQLQDSLVRKVANSLSLIGLIISISIYFWYHKRNEK